MFNVYVYSLNENLSNSKLGCHIRGVPINNSFHADDLTQVGPSAMAVNMMMKVCDAFAINHGVINNTMMFIMM